MLKATIMGAGAWGTTLAKIMADAGNSVTVWARSSKIVEEINVNHCNSKYLGNIILPSSIKATVNPIEALKGAYIIIFGLPAQSLRVNLKIWKNLIANNVTLVSLAKGIELNSLMRMSQVIEKVTNIESSHIAVISGPNLAIEIAKGQPTATVIACSDSLRALMLQYAFTTKYFVSYTTSDVVGTEIGGACKNIVALACGMASGLGLGENTIAAIIARGLDEITHLGLALGAKPKTLFGLAGLGDLVATCKSTYSRNRNLGEKLSKKIKIQTLTTETKKHTVEGITSCKPILALASNYGITMPLVEIVYSVCQMKLSAYEAVKLLFK